MKKIYILIIAIFTISFANAQWQPVAINYNYWVYSLVADSNKIILGTHAGVYVSTNYGANWIFADSSFTAQNIQNFIIKGDSIFANSIYGVYLSTNNATSWSTMNTGLTDTDVRALTKNGNNIYAGTVSGMIFLSTNNASNWTNLNTGFINTTIKDILVDGNNIYAGTNRGIYLSTNNGISWNQINTGIADTNITKLTISGSNIIAGTISGKIFLSSNNGSSWSLVLSPGFFQGDLITAAFAKIADTVYAAITFSGVYRSTDNGNTWKFTNQGMIDSVNTLTISGNNVFAGTWHGLCRHSFADFWKKFTITTTSSPLAGGSTTGDGLYTIYHPCTVKAIPNQGYNFSNWSINTSNYNWYSDTVYTFDVVGDYNMYANFNILSLSAGTISGDTLFCAPVNNKVYHVPPIAGVNSDSTGYEWHYTGNGASLKRSITGDTVYISFSQYIYPGVLTVRGQNSLGHGPWSSGCHLNSLTVPNNFSYNGNTIFCMPDTVALNINSNPYTTFTWNINPVAGLTVLNTTPSSCILYVDTTAPNNINIGISSSNMCGTGSNTIQLTPQKLPLYPGNISGPANVYAGQQNVVFMIPYSANNMLTYLWTLPAGVTGYSNQINIIVNYNSLAVSGNITVRGHNTCGNGPSSSHFVNVSPVIPNCSAQFTMVADTTVLHHYFVVNNASGVQPLHYIWNWGDGTQDTIAYPSHTYSTAGYYNICLTITDSVGCTTSYCNFSYLQKSPNVIISVQVIPQAPLNIKEIAETDGVKIYPNPAKDNITIEYNSNINQDFTIFNLLGKIVYTSTFKDKVSIDISAFQNGLYFIKINADKEVVVKKFVKE